MNRREAVLTVLAVGMAPLFARAQPVAKALAVTVPQSLLIRVNQVIE